MAARSISRGRSTVRALISVSVHSDTTPPLRILTTGSSGKLVNKLVRETLGKVRYTRFNACLRSIKG